MRASAASPMVELSGVEKVFRSGRLAYPALRGIDLIVATGEFVAVAGPSGSGKSTILNMITGIDRPTSGTVSVSGVRIDTLDQDELAAWRGANVGIIFQFFQLLPTLSALENAVLPMELAGRGTGAERAERARKNLGLVGLADKADHLPAELSGGEQQRVAIARALACDPPLLIGDEPTGNLDSETAREMLDLLATVNQDGVTIVFVTHDRELAARADRTIGVRDGRIVDPGTS